MTAEPIAVTPEHIEMLLAIKQATDAAIARLQANKE